MNIRIFAQYFFLHNIGSKAPFLDENIVLLYHIIGTKRLLGV